MKVYNTSNIKNIVLLGHGGSGKTTLVETMLYESGAITRRGAVEQQNTVSDFHELEHQKGNSVYSSLMHAEWRGNKINIIDTPGYDDFIGEVVSALRVADTGVMVLNAAHGVEVGTELMWEYTEKFRTPMVLVANQLDHEKSDFETTVQQAKSVFGNNVTVVQYPLNQGKGFNAIIDVLKMTMYTFDANGGKPTKHPIPDSERERANKLHNELVETIAANDEGLMELYFEKGELDEPEMARGLHVSMIKHDIFPLFCCSAKQNMGSGRIMGFLHDIAPSAKDVPPVHRESGKTLDCDPNAHVCLFIFKTLSEPRLGDMAYFKVYSGTVKAGAELINAHTGAAERLTQLFVINGKERISVTELQAGDIGATVKLKSSHTNNTLHEKNSPYRIKKIDFPESRISVAIKIDNKADIEKVAMALHQLHEEDPTIIIDHSHELKQLLIHAQGELHLNVVKWKMENLYKLSVEFEKPRVPFRETIRKMVKSEYRHKKQSGGAGQFGEVHMQIEPYYEGMPDPKEFNVRHREEFDLEWGGKLLFLNCIVGGAIDVRFLPSILKGVMEKMHNGPLTGSYVRDVRVCVFDGKMHDVDSNDMAFKLAGMMAFKNGFEQASPQILEPIYEVIVTCTDANMGAVMGDLQTRRAIIMGIDAEGHYQKIKANVPLMELYKYASSLRAITHGRAKHSQTFLEYAPVPTDIQQKLIEEHKKHAQEEL